MFAIMKEIPHIHCISFLW